MRRQEPRFVGPQGTGAMRLYQERKRDEALERQARYRTTEAPKPAESETVPDATYLSTKKRKRNPKGKAKKHVDTDAG